MSAIADEIEAAVQRALRPFFDRLEQLQPGLDPNAGLSPAAAGRVAGCCAETVRRAVRNKELPATKRGRSVVLALADVRQWMAKGNGKSAAATPP